MRGAGSVPPAGDFVALRPGLLAPTSFLISSICAGASAQTAPSSSRNCRPPHRAPLRAGSANTFSIRRWRGTAATAPASEQAPSVAGTELPTIKVTAPKPSPKPKQARPTQARPAAQVAAPTAPSPPPSPYETGAPNVAGGTPVVPQLASQMTISGEDLNARPILRSTDILEAAPGPRHRPDTPAPARPTNIICAATISIMARTWLYFGTTSPSICRPTPTARVTPTEFSHSRNGQWVGGS